MLSLTLVIEIRRLLDEGELSQRTIAEKLGVSRGIVSQLANGQRDAAGRIQPSRVTPRDVVRGLPARCPRCGGLVHAPCLLCETRDYNRRQRLRLSNPQRPTHDPRRVA